MKTTKQLRGNLILLTILSAMAGSALAAPSFSYRLHMPGVKGIAGGAPQTGTGTGGGTTAPGGTTQPGGTGSTGGTGGGFEPDDGGGFNPGGSGGDGLETGDPITVVPAENETAYFSMTKSGVSRYTATVTVQNTSSEAIYGPLSLMFKDLPTGVTLQNPAGNYGGMNYVYLTTDGQNPIMPGQQLSVNVTFANPNNVAVTFNNLVYSGYVDSPAATP